MSDIGRVLAIMEAQKGHMEEWKWCLLKTAMDDCKG